MRQKLIFSVVLFSLFSFVLNVQSVIKVGIIGLDTSHSPAFIEMLNSAQPKAKYEGFRIVAAYPYGSRTIESSYKRIPDYTEKAKKAGVEIVGSIAELLPKVDCIMVFFYKIPLFSVVILAKVCHLVLIREELHRSVNRCV